MHTRITSNTSYTQSQSTNSSNNATTSNLQNSAQRTANSFTTVCNDLSEQFKPVPRSHRPTIVVSGSVAAEFENGDGEVGALGCPIDQVLYVFNHFADTRPGEQLYSATDLTNIWYISGELSKQFSAGIYAFFQDYLEDVMFEHPEWMEINSNNQFAVRSTCLDQLINHLIATRAVDGPKGERCINIFLNSPAQSCSIPFTCKKLEKGILKYAASLEPLIEKLLNFRDSRVLINRALNDRKLTIIAGTNNSSVPRMWLGDRTLMLNEALPLDTQLGHLFWGFCDAFTENKKEVIRLECGKGKVGEKDFVSRFTKLDYQKEKLFNTIISQGMNEGKWGEACNILNKQSLEAIKSSEAFQRFYSSTGNEEHCHKEWKSLYNRLAKARNAAAASLFPDVMNASGTVLTMKSKEHRRKR